MTNDSRKIVRFLLSKFPERQEPDVDEIIALEQSIMAYYPNPIIKVMEGMIEKAKPEKLPNYANFIYHLPGLRRITSKRASNPIKLISRDEFKKILLILDKLIIVDYNLDTLLTIIELANGIESGRWNELSVRKSVETARQAGVYSPNYVYAIVQREHAEKQAALQRAQEVANSAQSAEVKQQQSNMSIIEQMSIEALWNERKENAELERKFNRMIRR